MGIHVKNSAQIIMHTTRSPHILPKCEEFDLEEGIHRFEDPVSKMTRNDCGGVPMLISPYHSA